MHILFSLGVGWGGVVGRYHDTRPRNRGPVVRVGESPGRVAASCHPSGGGSYRQPPSPRINRGGLTSGLHPRPSYGRSFLVPRAPGAPAPLPTLSAAGGGEAWQSPCAVVGRRISGDYGEGLLLPAKPGKGELRLKKADRAGDAGDSPGVM